MKNNIHFFSSEGLSKKNIPAEKIGMRGRQAVDFALLNLPILPGFIIDSEVAAYLEDSENLIKNLKSNIKKLEEHTGKEFGNPEKPLLLKIVISSNLAIAHYPTLHNYGLTDETIPGFNGFVGKNFGFHEILFLINGNLEIEEKIAELEKREKDLEKIRSVIDSLSKDMEKEEKPEERIKTIERYKSMLDERFFSDAYIQLEIALKRISRMLKYDEMNNDDTAILVQPMVYGNYGKDSASGMFFTRDIVTGEKKLSGFFSENKFDTIESEGKDINKLGKNYLKELESIARTVEDHFREIRSIRFTIENHKVWLIDQRPVMIKSAQADIQTLLDLNKRKVVDDEYVIKTVNPNQLHEILHPVLNRNSVRDLKVIKGGICGAPGAAIGRVFFTTDSLLEAYKLAQVRGEDTRFILCMPATFAEDVKAIEVAKGVLSSEGGYSAHASVVARQYGKVSLVNTGMRIHSKKATIGDINLKEGDYVTLNVPQYGEPELFLGKGELIEPDPESSGLIDLISIIKKFVNDFHVRANADKPRDAALALKFGAEGIGLCRTEHMFFEADRINVFREMIISGSTEDREKTLKKLKNMQRDDFYKIFKIMEGREVTIRLLDAPLHEFLPHNEDEMNAFMEYLKKRKDAPEISKNELKAIIDGLSEFNPMLGHRGCRIAISYPEIYEMQIQAIFEAAFTLRKENIEVHPEIMIPLIMNENELKIIVYGKKIEGKYLKGIKDIEKEVREKMNAEPIPYKIGTMIELPVAALGAGSIAKYAQFFSFGTNDLTQTTIGLSRDDFNSFMPDYTQFDILNGNPFQVLDDHVKELIEIAARRGKMTRPDIVTGLCGEHGAVPENIKFCMETGLDYVSCSSYSVPIANLAVAQRTLEREKN
ncbi:MAG: pyruvate, phosphate dikinase [Spirochaetes bacterium]|nr:MAG: pyruvate, phosphate dikinase [Spirochaetota bacterium]